MGGSLPFWSGVVVSLRPLSICHGPMWLVPALFPSLSLSFPVCTHLLLGRDFLLLPDCPSPYFGLWVYWFLWLLFSTRVTYLRDGVTPAGSWTDVLDRNEGLVSPFGSGTLVSSWLDIPPLSAGICVPCHSGYVAWWSSLCPYH